MQEGNLMEVILMKELLGENEKIAEQNKEYFCSNHILTVNLLGSPGAGKTTLISALAKELPDVNIGVIEGDIASSIDTEKLSEQGIKSIQINTCGQCHLDASVVRQAAEELRLTNSILFIENVGNLICPAEFNLGENLRLLAASVPEGDDKPFKYITMFSHIDVVALTKCDLKKAVGFDDEYFKKGLAAVSEAPVFEITLKKGLSPKGVSELAELILGKYSSL